MPVVSYIYPIKVKFYLDYAVFVQRCFTLFWMTSGLTSILLLPGCLLNTL